MMTVVIKKVGRPAIEGEIANTLEELQKFVGGSIETVGIAIGHNRLIVICDEEGKLKGKQPNFPLPWNDVIVGDALITALGSNGDFRALTQKEVYDVLEFFRRVKGIYENKMF